MSAWRDRAWLSPSERDGRRRGPDARPSRDPLAKLAGRSILIAEDEPIVALDLQLSVEDEGGLVQGPFHRLTEAMVFLTKQDERIDAAILDVNLNGVLVFPLAQMLAERGVPFVFHTGNAETPQIARDFPGRPVFAKPAAPASLLRGLAGLLE